MIRKRPKYRLQRLAYTLDEVADMLHVSVQHLRNEEKRGKLKFFKSASLTRILKVDLEAYAGHPIEDVLECDAV